MTLTPDNVFTWASQAALPGWILLALLPRWRVTQWIVLAGILPFLLGLVYIGVIGSKIAQGGLDFSQFNSLVGVKSLFQDDWVVVGGWVHYLVFDLWTGAWEVRDSRRVGIPHLAVIPCLFVTLMLGPTGLVVYFLIRWLYARRFEVE
jgi:hypothetical protein